MDAWTLLDSGTLCGLHPSFRGQVENLHDVWPANPTFLHSRRLVLLGSGLAAGILGWRLGGREGRVAAIHALVWIVRLPNRTKVEVKQKQNNSRILPTTKGATHNGNAPGIRR